MSLERYPGSVASISRGTSTAVEGQRRFDVGGFGSPSFNSDAVAWGGRRPAWPRALAAVVALFLPTIVCATAEEEPVAVIHLRPQVRAASTDVTLGEMADVIASSDDFRTRLAAAEIRHLSAATLSVEVPQAEIARRLAAQGFRPTQVRIVGAEIVSISKSSADVLSGQVRATARRKLAQLWQVPEGDVDVQLSTPLAAAELGDAPSQTVDVFFHERQQPGLMRVRASLSNDDRSQATIWLSLQATLYGDVVVAARPLRRGDFITEEDADTVRRPIRRTSALVPWEDIVGHVARQPLRQGQPIQAYQVETRSEKNEYVIRPRDAVRLTARKGTLTITVSDAEALQRGRIGDSIRVKNPRSKKIVIGRVISRNEVQVLF